MKPEKNIMKLFKYQALSEVRHFEFIKNYISQKVWITPLKNFNDPFEGHFRFVSFTPEFVLGNSEVFGAMLQEHIKIEGPDFTAKDLESRLLADEIRQDLKKSKVVRDLLSNHGAFCLTASNNNIPMWSYYADNHKGCCIEFELDFTYIKNNAGILDGQIDEFKNGVLEGTDIISFNLKSELDREFAFVKVGYSDDLHMIEGDKAVSIKNSYDQSEYIIRNSVGVKFKQWEHEREYRLVTNSNSESSGLLQLRGYAPFLKITGIILGSKIDSINKEIICALCDKSEINVYKATCSDEGFDIIVSDSSNAEPIMSVDGLNRDILLAS